MRCKRRAIDGRDDLTSNGREQLQEGAEDVDADDSIKGLRSLAVRASTSCDNRAFSGLRMREAMLDLTALGRRLSHTPRA